MNDLTVLIPCYNVENCLLKTLENIMGKVHIILVDDGSLDNTKKVLKSVKKTKVEVYFNEENKGLAETRNILISKVKTKYFTFLDAGDYLDLNVIDEDLLSKNYDLISYNINIVNEDKKTINKYEKIVFEGSGEDFLNKLILKSKAFDSACSYIYKTSFIKENNFTYLKGYNHEDFGLTPYILLKTPKVLSLDKVLYYYVQDENSITRGLTPIKVYNNALSIIANYKRLVTLVPNSHKIFYSFLTNTLINKIDELDGEYKIKYIKELNELKVYNGYMKNIKGLIKKTLYLIKYGRIK